MPCLPAHGSPATRRRRGLICIEVTQTRPIAAPRSGPGNFQKAQARHAAPVRLSHAEIRRASALRMKWRRGLRVAWIPAWILGLCRDSDPGLSRDSGSPMSPQATDLAPPRGCDRLLPPSRTLYPFQTLRDRQNCHLPGRGGTRVTGMGLRAWVSDRCFSLDRGLEPQEQTPFALSAYTTPPLSGHGDTGFGDRETLDLESRSSCSSTTLYTVR